MLNPIEASDQDDFCDFLRMEELIQDQSGLNDDFFEKQSGVTSDSLLNPFVNSDKEKGIFS